MTETKNPEVEVLQAGKPGPKRKYDPTMCETIKNVAREGGHQAAMMDAIGVHSKDTFYRWLREYPEFGEAYEDSKVISQSVYEKLLFMGSIGQIKGFNVTGFAMIMNNKFPEEYKRSAMGSNTEININQMNLPMEELQKRIAATAEELQSKGVDVQKLLGVK